MKHLVIIAGEESGDQHAAEFVRTLTKTHPDLRLSGIGGTHMQKAGVELISDLARYGITGLSGIVTHARVIRRAYRDMQAHLTTHRPDLLVLVDYPGFNLRLAKFAKKHLKLRILYYISPQIWAWKARRIETIRAYVDHMAVIFPFEQTLYEHANIPVSFVGHPLVKQLEEPLPLTFPSLGPGTLRLALLPGSRVHEIKHHMPTLCETIRRLQQHYPTLHVLVPVAETIDPNTVEAYLKTTSVPFTLIKGQARAVMASSDAIIVASGTASLECALLKKPMCIIYKTSLLTSLLASKFMKVRYLGLCNLLQNAMIVPELLGYDCNPKELTRVTCDLLSDDAYRTQMLSRLGALKDSLSAQRATTDLTTLIAQMLALPTH